MPRSATRHAPARPLLALALAIPALGLIAPAAQADTTGTTPYVVASGTVTDDAGTPISGVQVIARGLSASSSTGATWTVTQPILGTSAVTDGNGVWRYDLPPGTYEFEYRTAAYADEYDADAGFADQATPHTMTTPAAETSLGTARLHKSATVTGTVKDINGNPIGGATATVQYQAADHTWQSAAAGTTSAAGTWTLTVPPTSAGNAAYRLRITGSGYQTEYYTGADKSASPSETAAVPFAAAPGVTTDLKSVTLADTTTQKGTLAGTVRAADGSIPAGGSIQLYSETVSTSSTGARHDVWAALGAATPVASGAYALDEPAGTYRLAYFQDGQAPVFYPAAQGLDGASNLTVTAGQTTAANIALPQPGTVTGHVTYASLPADATLFAQAPYVYRIDNGVPSVQYAPVESPLPSNLTSGSQASYRIDLPAGTWVVGAKDDSGHLEYAPNAATPAGAQPIRVTAGATASDVDIELAPAPGTLTQVQFTVPPSISGTIGVGSRLTADPGVWLPTTASSPTYQWSADGTAILGATDQSYTLTAAQVGHRISVAVTVSKAGLPTEQGSAATAAVPTTTTTTTDPGGLGGLLTSLLGGGGTTTTTTTTPKSPTASAAPTISGTPTVGQLLTASTGTWSAAQGTAHYQWYADGQVIPWANAARHVATADDAGHALSVRVWWTDQTNNLTGSSTSAATARVAAPAITNQTPPSISGSPVVGQTLVANTGTWTPQPTAWTYQWRADGDAIGGATGSTYVVAKGDAGKRISVDVKPARAGYSSTAATSPETAVVTAPSTGGTGGTGGTGSTGGTGGTGGTTGQTTGQGTSQGTAKPVAVVRIVQATPLRHGRVRVVVRLSAAGARSFDGVLLARIGNHQNSVIAHNGTVRLTLTRVPPGRRLLRVVFRDSPDVLGGTAVRWVRVRR